MATSSRPITFKLGKTGIGGRQVAVRFRRVMLHVMVTWGTPWQEYVKPYEFTVRRVKHGFQGHHRCSKPYLRWQLQWFPAGWNMAPTPKTRRQREGT